MGGAAGSSFTRAWPWVAGYLALVIPMVVGLALLRPRVLETMGAADEARDWQKWRDAAAMQTGADGRVQRKMPKSAEPPALVLMRDHFALIVGATVVFTGAMYGFIAVLASGMLRERSGQRSDKSRARIEA